MTQPLVTVILPVYNSAPHLATCLESICRQKYENLQILVINDGSHDSSMHIVNMYAKKDGRIVAVDKDNRGVSATRNAGIRMAKGEYLQFVDSDDYLDENATRLLVEKMQESNADLVISHYCHQTNTKKTIHGFLTQDKPISKNEFAVGLMEEPASFYYGVMWNKLYKTDIIHRHNIQCNVELGWSEDFLFNLEYIRHAHHFIALKTPIYYYVYNKNSIVHTQIDVPAVVKGKTTLFKYYKQLYQELGLYEANKAQIHKYLIATAEYL